MKPGVNIFSPVLREAAAPAFPAFTAAGTERRFCRFDLGMFLAQMLVCTLPTGALMASGRVALAGYFFWFALGMTLLRLALVGRRDEILCMILAVGPFINLLREFAFYNIAIAVFVVGLFYHFALASGLTREIIKRTPLIWSLAILTVIFYLLSFINTRDYSVNLRLFELVFAATFILLIGRNQTLLAAALLGMIISAWIVGVSLLPHTVGGSRLGIVQVGGKVLGNPTQLGVPLAFGFLAIAVDRGRWLKLQTKPLWRLLLLIPTLPLLALTTSRASWIMAAGGIFLCMLLSSRQRIKMILIIALVAGAFQAVLHSPYSSSLEKGLKRTFGDERSVAQRTSGRSDQWKVSWFAFNRSVDSMIHGYGPGRGPETYAKYSGQVDGVKYNLGKLAALHSLFMQVGVEAGAIGLGLLAIWLLMCLFKVLKNSFSAGILFPLVCLFGYVTVVITVSGADINSGVLLGIALLGTLASGAKSSQEGAAKNPSFTITT